MNICFKYKANNENSSDNILHQISTSSSQMKKNQSNSVRISTLTLLEHLKENQAVCPLVINVYGESLKGLSILGNGYYLDFS